MRAKKIAVVSLTIAAVLAAAAFLAWRWLGHALAEFAKGGVC
jgi:hypothetical protein